MSSRDFAGPVVQPGIPRTVKVFGLKNVRFAKIRTDLELPKGRGFKSRPVHHHLLLVSL